MEHRHGFAYIDVRDGKKSMGIEIWPPSERSPATTTLKVDRDSPIVFMREDGDDVPIVPVSRTHGWRMGGGRLTYVAFTDLADNRFYLSFSEARLDEAMNCLVAAMSDLSGGVLAFGVPVSDIAIRAAGSDFAIRVTLLSRRALELNVPAEVFRKFRQAISAEG
jgi:hypothetical protein